MSYPPEFKREARKQYRGGMRLRRIAERMEIPLSTIRYWTQDLKPPRRFVFNCPVCDELTVRKHLNQKYCLNECKRCKRQAKYQRSKQKKTRRASRQCIECRKPFPPRTNKRFCSKRCKDRAAKRRERQLNPLKSSTSR